MSLSGGLKSRLTAEKRLKPDGEMEQGLVAPFPADKGEADRAAGCQTCRDGNLRQTGMSPRRRAARLTGALGAPSLVAGSARASRNPRQRRHRREVLPRRRERVRPRNDTLPRGKKARRTSPGSLSLWQSPRNQRTASPRKPQPLRRTPSETGSHGSARGSPGALPHSATISLRC